MTKSPLLLVLTPLRKNISIPVKKAEVPFFNCMVLAEDEYQSIPVNTSSEQFDPHRWLRSVLREDVVPLQVVTARARLEGVDMQEFWCAIRESCIQQDGMNGTRYLKLPRTIWAIPKPPLHCEDTPDPVAQQQAAKSELARLKLAGDDRIVCRACCFRNGTECPSGQPMPDSVPNRCPHFQERDWS